MAHGDLAITWGDVADTLVLLEALLPRLDAEPELLAQRFRWVRLTEGASFSGYYEPVVMASRTCKAGYVQPLYGLPSDLRQLDLGRFQPMLTGQRLAYRMSGGEPVPYYARAEIDGEAGVLRGRGLELAWVDPVDAYFLQVQGSGRLRFEDGSEKALLYAGTNGRPYLSIGQYLSGWGSSRRTPSACRASANGCMSIRKSGKTSCIGISGMCFSGRPNLLPVPWAAWACR